MTGKLSRVLYMYASDNGSDNDDEVYGIVVRLYEIESRLELKLLRNEARVLALIKSDPGNSVKYYLGKSDVSSRWFYKIISDLIEGGYLKASVGPDDNRRKVLF